MNIGIDIDDVITNTSGMFKEYFEKYGKEYFEESEMEDNLKYIMRGNFVNDKIKKFMLRYITEMLEKVAIKENVIEVLTRLKENGNNIILITTRGSRIFNGAEEMTKLYLKENKIPYDNIIFNAYDKYLSIKENKINLMVDDSVEICESLNSKGVKVYLFTTDVNKDDKTNIQRISDWIDLEDKISKES